MRREPIIEEWRTVVGYPDYEVSSLGRVRRVTPGRGNAVVGKILKPRTKNNGYLNLFLYDRNGNRKDCGPGILVLEAFVGPRPDGYECNHKDGDKKNNCVWNLEWVTKSENRLHAYRSGLQRPLCGEKIGNSKYTEDQAWEVKRLTHYGLGPMMVSERTGVGLRSVYHIRLGGSWCHLKRTPV